MLSKADPLAMALDAAFSTGYVCDDAITVTDDEEDNLLTPTQSRNPYARPCDTYFTTTATDEGGVELTPSASSDPASTIFSGATYTNNDITTEVNNDAFSYCDCRPLNITNSVKVRDGYLFAVHFEDCGVGVFNVDNCIMINVTFEDCRFGHTTFSNLFLKDVVFKGCHFDEYLWQNDRIEDRTMTDEYCSGTWIGDKVPKELSEPDWLANELDGTNELIRAIEAGQIEDVQADTPDVAVADDAVTDNDTVLDACEEREDYVRYKLREWNEFADGPKPSWW